MRRSVLTVSTARSCKADASVLTFRQRKSRTTLLRVPTWDLDDLPVSRLQIRLENISASNINHFNLDDDRPRFDDRGRYGGRDDRGGYGRYNDRYDDRRPPNRDYDHYDGGR